MSVAAADAQPGHVFLAHGRLESLVHDAAIVPTDKFFSVRAYWKPLLGTHPQELQPDGWPKQYGRAADGTPIWFIDVGDAPSSARNG